MSSSPDLDRRVLGDLRHDLHQGEAGVPPLLRIERADPHQPVHAALALQPAVGPSAIDREGHALQPRLFALGLVQDLGLEAGAIGPAQIHAQQHLGPVLRLGAAGSGMDRYDRRPLVVWLGQQEPRLHPLPVGGEGVQVPLQVRGQPVTRLAVRLGQLRDLGQAVGTRLQAAPGGDLLAQLVGAAKQCLRGLLVVPQIGIAAACGQLGELGFLGGQVKGAPPCRPRGAPGAAPRP